ncbi:MAG: SH3 domain-containing protein [Candidatus Glassbacteria bacterium]
MKTRHFIPAPAALFCLLVIFAPRAAIAAETVTVARDGSLLFAEPDNNSPVLDILSRETRLEVIEKAGEWYKVYTPDRTRQGYIRSEAVRTGVAFPQLDLYRVAGGSGAYSDLQGSLDETETRLRQAELLIGEIETRLEALRAAQQPSPSAKRSGNRQMGSAPSLSFGAFPAFYLENTDYAAGAAVIWHTSWLGPFNLDLDAGMVLVEGSDDVIFADLGVIYPLSWQFGRFSPYLAAAGGMLRHKPAGLENKVNPTASAGGGIAATLNGRFELRLDARLVVEFADQDQVKDGRFYLGLFYSL